MGWAGVDGMDISLEKYGEIIAPTVIMTVYLSVVDYYVSSQDVWTISTDFSTG